MLSIRKDELRKLDNVDAVIGANKKLAEELKENRVLVNSAKETKRKLDKVEKSLTEETETSKRLREEKKRCYDKLYRQREANDNLRKEIAATADADQLRIENEQLWQEFDEMRANFDDAKAELVQKEEEIEDLREQLSTTIQTTDSRGQYLPEFRLLMMKVLGHNVPHEHASAVIKDVLAYAGREASSLPDERTIRDRMNIERLSVSHLHIGVLSC